jgi:PAS domain S-box-containing protein
MAGQAVISESSDDAIVSRTLNGIVTSWNPAAERMFGYSTEEIVGKHINLLIPEDRTREILSIPLRDQCRQVCQALRDPPCPKGWGEGHGLADHLADP